MTPYLFVYGTLMRRAAGVFGRAERTRLAREAEWLGPASTRGRLYSLGRYPGLTVSGGPCERVHGEAYRLREPLGTLDWLDAFEGTGRGELAEYERLLRPVRLASGRSIAAWIYVCRRPAAGLCRLPSGRWPVVAKAAGRQRVLAHRPEQRRKGRPEPPGAPRP